MAGAEATQCKARTKSQWTQPRKAKMWARALVKAARAMPGGKSSPLSPAHISFGKETLCRGPHVPLHLQASVGDQTPDLPTLRDGSAPLRQALIYRNISII
uniref:Uncharacterized protein n=1 Tax=Thermogemmatispora argillosa TaxID=2045280 RepID=A0A455T828_9CHLR|nr:hypothetical protein KTA_38170 [Thermogemmatispora argillosa]